ncbi:hypothetical protein ACFWFX_26680 [Streptomyces roseolus]|uniref:hypothetical protein n=1 Tax=Streptomyces roseolus TaxID=67358 RepID=UPI0036543947
MRGERHGPVTGKLLGADYDDHAAAVTSTAAELHRAGIGHLPGFATGIGHRLAGGYVQRAALMVRAPEAGLPVLLLEIDRRSEDAHDPVQKLRRYGERGPLLPKDAAKHTVDLVRSRPDGSGDVDHGLRLWRRVYPPTGREGPVPLAFVFADTTEAKASNTVAVLEEADRRSWAPRRYDSPYEKAVTARGYRQAVPVVVTTLEQLQEHGADTAVWRRLERDGEQTLTATLDNPDGPSSTAYRRPSPKRRASGAVPPSGRRSGRCAGAAGGSSTTRARRRSPCTRTAVRAGDTFVCGPCRADDVAREEAEAARRQAVIPPEPEHDPEPGKLRGLFRRRGRPTGRRPSRRARGGTAPTSSGLSRAGAACSASTASGERRPARPLLALTELTRRFRPRGAASRGRTEESAHRPGHGHGP